MSTIVGIIIAGSILTGKKPIELSISTNNTCIKYIPKENLAIKYTNVFNKFSPIKIRTITNITLE